MATTTIVQYVDAFPLKEKITKVESMYELMCVLVT